MNVMFSPEAWEDYLYWQRIDKKAVSKINSLIKEISRNPYEGNGNPEALKHRWSGFWSRRISNEDRLIYRIVDESIEIAQCRLHY